MWLSQCDDLRWPCKEWNIGRGYNIIIIIAYLKYWLISSTWSQQIFCEIHLSPTFEAAHKQNDEMCYGCLAQSFWGYRIKHWHALYCNARHCLPYAETHRREYLKQHHIAKSPPMTFSQPHEDLFACMHDLSGVYTTYSYGLLLYVPLNLVASEITIAVLLVTYICKSPGGPFGPRTIHVSHKVNAMEDF